MYLSFVFFVSDVREICICIRITRIFLLSTAQGVWAATGYLVKDTKGYETAY